MKTLDILKKNRAYIQKVLQTHRTHNLRVFGSVLRGEDRQDSDIDLLIDPLPDMSLFDLGAIQYELSEFLGKPVDVLTPNSLPDKFRQQVMLEAAAL